MDFRNTVEALEANTNEILRLLSILRKPEGLRKIDIDLILEKLRSMYDLVLDIRVTVEEQANEINREDNRIDSLSFPVENREIADAPKQHEETERKKEPYIELDNPDSEIIPEKSKEEKLKERKQAARNHIEQDLKKEKAEQTETGAKKTIISDRFVSKPTLAEELVSKKKHDDLASQLKTQVTTSITGSIGLNEKFELINELFDGNKEKYEYTLQVLNMAGSFVEAYNYLKENFNWDMDDPHVQRLLEQIRRKLIVNRKDE